MLDAAGSDAAHPTGEGFGTIARGPARHLYPDTAQGRATPATGRLSRRTDEGVRAKPLGLLALVCTAFLALITADVLYDARAVFDAGMMRAVQRIDLSGLEAMLRPVDNLTGAVPAALMWITLFVLFATLRWWLPATAILSLPLGGLVTFLMNALVGRERPAVDEVQRAIAEADTSAYPSGHVAGAVLLYGLLIVIAGRIRNRYLRLLVQTACVAVIVLTGFGRLWYGAHWPSDVLAAYALGGAMLAGIIAVYHRLEALTGPLPFVQAAPLPHDESAPHVHMLAGLRVFEGGAVEKVYAPGYLPRVLYWLAFQAEFPYIRNRAALHAALHRRNLAAMLTEYWYGGRRVARVLDIEPHEGGYRIRGEHVAGRAPEDRRAVNAWLRDLRGRFDEAGLPTWPVDPRHPGVLASVVETDEGEYVITDLESDFITPLASRRSWGRALRRGLLLMFDDAYYDVTRAYIAARAEAMRAACGDVWLDQLVTTLNAAERETLRWHRSEPRIWGTLISRVQHGFGHDDRPAQSGPRWRGSLPPVATRQPCAAPERATPEGERR